MFSLLFIMSIKTSELVCIIGVSSSGKDTAANILVNNYNFHHVKVTRPLKELMELAYNLPIGYLDSLEGKSQYVKKLDGSLYPFTYKQQLTELFHIFESNSNIDIELWVKLAMRNIRELIYTQEADVVISDIRRQIEVDEIIHITRHYNVNTKVISLSRNESYISSADTEFRQNYNKFRQHKIPVFDIDNNGTIAELQVKLDAYRTNQLFDKYSESRYY